MFADDTYTSTMNHTVKYAQKHTNASNMHNNRIDFWFSISIKYI